MTDNIFCLNITKQILAESIMAISLQKTSFTWRVHTSEATARTIARFCSGFAQVEVRREKEHFPARDVCSWELLVYPKISGE